MAIEYESSNGTPCQIKPWKCHPRKTRLVAFDADETMWFIEPHVIATNICGPFKKIDDDTVEAFECGSKSYSSTPVKVAKQPSKYYQPYPHEVKYSTKTHSYESLEGFAKPEPNIGEIQDALLDNLTPKQKRLVQLVDENRLAMKDLSKSEQSLYNTIKKAREQISMLPSITRKALPPPQPEPKPEPAPAPKMEAPREEGNGKKITVKLLPTFRETINELERRKIAMTIISLNAPGSVSNIMKAFGFADKFTEIADTWRNKGEVLKEQMEKMKIAPDETIFVDNMTSHVRDATSQCAMGLVIAKGKDIQNPIEIMKYIEGSNG